MVENIKHKKASEKERFLYSCLGEALCAVQILEDALSHSIVLKKTESNQKNEADILIQKQQFYTFGKAIYKVEKESLLPEPLVNELIELRDERNWLIHESIIENKKDYKSNNFFKKLSEKTKGITLKAKRLQVSIELDMIQYSEKKGINTSKVKIDMRKNYGLNF
jgi:hypothetical protein